MKHKIARIPILLILIASIVVITCILLFACGSTPTNAEAETSQVNSYELYVLDNFSNGEIQLALYNIYKVKSENIESTISYGNVITTYNATDGTQIIFANNGVTVISPKDHKESFTQGYMRRRR